MPAKYTEYLLTLAMGLIILTTITVTFQGMYENVEEDVIQQELEGVVQKIAQDVTNIYLIGKKGEGTIDWKIEVKITLPSDIGGLFYQISVVDSTGDLRPDSLQGVLLTKNDILVQINLSPIVDQIQIRGGFQSTQKNHILRYHLNEALIELIDR